MAVTLASASTIVPRGPQTNATCTSDYDWTDNESGLSPCLLASYLLGSCLTGDYGVWSLPADSHYDPPNVGTMSSTPCSCSWSVYNLLSACTVCQGNVNSVLSWAYYKAECPDNDLSTTTFYPYDKGYELPEPASIPYWAAQNPLNWPDGSFDSSDAKDLSSQDHPDLTSDNGTANNNGSSTPVGPIVGGVVGGVGVLALSALIAFFLFRRHRRRGSTTKSADRTSGQANGDTRSTMHLRSNSAMTQISVPTSFHSSGVVNMMNHSPPLSSQSPTRPTLHSRSSSSDVGSHASYFGSIHGTSALMSPTTAESQRMSVNLEDIITPFTGSLSDRGTAAYHIDATSMSSASHDTGSNDGSVGLPGHNSNNNPRMNPPAYSRYPNQIHQALEEAPPVSTGKEGMQVQNPVGSRPHSVVPPPPPSDTVFDVSRIA
ncbi:uncharacterized protein BT62DRAFT_935003 [Guyanagaster necrorhizus]|uniref:Uncharacterized protein n=1 Tax=Guyanagaster necrorhizus TaxID=856835 RepID=A0A9P8AQ26_9AGAR|nr:uncharacterized protein BT62DRAFT_935003 [Guyanagaster necrorhizus MCA 3950]KAG7443391.1 hypothetical protein BT62DRAFT_935003 [Guyanagaster necrorhizus MCA 3950]